MIHGVRPKQEAELHKAGIWVAPPEAHGKDEPMGSEANFMFEWLKPFEGDGMGDVKALLLKRFALIGDTAQLPLLLLEMASLQGMDMGEAARRIIAMAGNHANPSPHRGVLEYFNETEYAALARRHS